MIGVSNTSIFRRFINSIPKFFSDLITWHKGITDTVFTEKIEGLPATFLPAIAEVDGDSELQFSSLSGVSITSSDGTSTPSINGNNIEFTSGTCSNLLLDDGTFIPDVYSGYDTAGSNDATVVDIDKGYSIDGSLHKREIGYTLYQNSIKTKWQVPFLLTGIAKSSPAVPAGYSEVRDVSGSKWNMADALVDFFNLDILCDEYKTVYDSFATKPNTGVINRQNVIVNSLVDLGVWAKLDFFHLIGGHTNDNLESFVNWINPGTYNIYISAGSPNYTANQGLKRNSSADIVKNNCLLDGNGKYKQDNATIGVCIMDNIAETLADIGTNSAIDVSLITRDASSSIRAKLNDTQYHYNVATTPITDSRGTTVLVRPAENRKVIYKNGIKVQDIAYASGGLPGTEVNILSDAAYKGTKRIGVAFGGSGLTDGDVKTITDSINEYFEYVESYSFEEQDDIILMGDKTLAYVDDNSDDVDYLLLFRHPKNIICTGDYAANGVPVSELLYLYDGYSDLEKIKSAIGNHDIAYSQHISFKSFFNLTKTYYTEIIDNIEFFFYDTLLKLDESGWDDMATAQARSVAETKSSTQGQWLINSLANSTAKWKILVYHIPTWCSNYNLNTSPQMAWDWHSYGVDLILNGHMHFYERLLIDTGTGSVPIINCGTSGANQLTIGTPASGSIIRISSATDADFDAGMFITLNNSISQLTFNLHSVDTNRNVIADKDVFILNK